MLSKLPFIALLSSIAFTSMADDNITERKLSKSEANVFNAALKELDGTMLQFSCPNKKYSIERILKPKPVSSLPVVKFDENKNVVAVIEREPFSCPQGEISIEGFCVEVVCTYTEVLSPEEAKKLMDKEKAAKGLLESQH